MSRIATFALGKFCLITTLVSAIQSEALAAGCVMPQPYPNLRTSSGFMEFIPQQELAPYLARLPRVSNPEVDQIIRTPETMWYDENSMVFTYQDSEETVVGGRANCVGRDVGERNRSNPAIARLMNYFGEDYRFKFPFRTVAGTDDVTNIVTLNFWRPPVDAAGQVMPVKWWKTSARGRWNWVFPAGTYFGEVLFQKSPDGQWYVFEVRTRKRYLDGWEVELFRPFRSAVDLANAIVRLRPDWESRSDLAALVRHLLNADNVVAHRLESPAFAKAFKPIDGWLDNMPAIDDHELIGQLLQRYYFVPTSGSIWKESNGRETYGPASLGEFHIVPRGYKLGMIPVNEISCKRCHEFTGQPLGPFDSNIVLYGEVWGEDQIFTWHLFKVHQRIFGTWDDVDQSRIVNPRMVQAGLVLNQKPVTGDPIYKKLPTNYIPRSFAVHP
jgi:hypothetical protein